MEGIKAYLLAVVGAAVICATVIRLVGDKGAQSAMTKLIAGLFLTFTVIRPIADIRFDDLIDFTNIYTDAGTKAAAAGELMTKDAIAASIKVQTEAYILDKATTLALDLQVDVTVSDDSIPVPLEVRISGKSSPYAKLRLQAIITQDLGIDKEHQIWT